MHKSFSSLFFILFALAAACSGDGIVRGKSVRGGLSAAEYNRLVDLNRMQQDNIDAREAVHHLVGPRLNEKSKPMSDKMAAPNCVKQYDVPEDDMTGVVNEETIAGPANGHCPIRWYRRRGWTPANKIMVITDNLQIFDAEYREKFSRLSARSMSGSYKVIPDAEGNADVSGNIAITNFQTLDYGLITGSIFVSFDRNNDAGAGSVILTLNGNRWGSTASLGWKYREGSASAVTYRVGNAKIDKEQFEELFSSYELDKYMDNALKMK